MKYFTFEEIKNRVLTELGLEQETFITPEEMLAFANEAIDEIEALIHQKDEDYFLSKTAFNLVQGQTDYDLPATIFASKIRGVLYKNGIDVRRLRRIKRTRDMFLVLENDQTNTSVAHGDYSYLLMNNAVSSTSGIKMVLSPVPDESVTNGIILYFIRNANRMEDSDSICDIPEFAHIVVQYMKAMCLFKEGNPTYNAAMDKYDRMIENLENTLTPRESDSDNELVQDRTFYNDTIGSYYDEY